MRSTLRELLALGLLAGALAASPAVAQTSNAGAWTTATPLPLARFEIGVAGLNDKIYVVGGHAAATDAVKLFQVYDPKTKAWSEAAPLPKPATHPALAELGGKLYAVGGFTENVHAGAVDRVYEYDPAANSWRQLPPLPRPLGSVGAIGLDGKLHVIGGRLIDKTTVTDHSVYDPKTGAWSAAAPLPLARDHLGIAAADGLIHVFGGRTAGGTDNVTQHDVYDPRTNSWRQAAPMPTARSGGAAVYYHGLIIYAGGECKVPATKQAFFENEAYDVKTDHWQTLARLPNTGRQAFGAAVSGNDAYFVAGSTGCQGDGASTDLLVFHLP